MAIGGQFSLFFNKTICSDPSSESSPRDGSDEESQDMSFWTIFQQSVLSPHFLLQFSVDFSETFQLLFP